LIKAQEMNGAYRRNFKDEKGINILLEKCQGRRTAWKTHAQSRRREM